jgi:phage tail sheath protein FI
MHPIATMLATGDLARRWGNRCGEIEIHVGSVRLRGRHRAERVARRSLVSSARQQISHSAYKRGLKSKIIRRSIQLPFWQFAANLA